MDCSRSDIVLERYTKCQQQGPYVGENALGDFHSQYAVFKSRTEYVLVYLVKPRIILRDSAVKVDPETREKALARPPAADMAKTSNFSSTVRLPNGYAKTFLYAPDWKCFSFVKDAPLRGAGVAYYLTGYTCGKGPEAPSQDRMTAFLGKLAVKF